jgi:hypothetical protein
LSDLKTFVDVGWDYGSTSPITPVGEVIGADQESAAKALDEAEDIVNAITQNYWQSSSTG